MMPCRVALGIWRLGPHGQKIWSFLFAFIPTFVNGWAIARCLRLLRGRTLLRNIIHYEKHFKISYVCHWVIILTFAISSDAHEESTEFAQKFQYQIQSCPIPSPIALPAVDISIWIIIRVIISFIQAGQDWWCVFLPEAGVVVKGRLRHRVDAGWVVAESVVARAGEVRDTGGIWNVACSTFIRQVKWK